EVGSTFTLYLPQTYSSAVVLKTGDTPELSESTLRHTPRESISVVLPSQLTKSAAAAALEEIAVDDDRDNIQPGDHILLIVEADATFARILVDMAHSQNMKALV